MSRARRQMPDPVVLELCRRLSGRVELRDLIRSVVEADPVAAADPDIYAAAIAASLTPGLNWVARSFIDNAVREAHPHARERVAELLGMSRQSVDAALYKPSHLCYERLLAEHDARRVKGNSTSTD